MSVGGVKSKKYLLTDSGGEDIIKASKERKLCFLEVSDYEF